MASVLAVTEPN